MWDFLVDAFNRSPEWLWAILSAILLVRIAWHFWIHYIQQDFISGIDFVLLEVIPPREVTRSPKAMELFISNALYHWSVKGGREEYWQGAVWFWFSLEIVSIEGQVHFYIYTPSRLKGLIETQMYAQYPQAQVRQVMDYTLAVDKISPDSAWQGWGCEFVLAKHHAYPIKTYVDFGLDKDPDEELKVDPISPIIELFAALEKGEQMWLQIVVRPSKTVFHVHGEKTDWVGAAQAELQHMLDPYTRLQEGIDKKVVEQTFTPPHLGKVIESMNAKIQKIGFDVGIRAMYIAKKENWSMNSRRNIRLIFRQFANPQLNSFERTNSTQADAYGGLITVLSPEKVMVLSDRMLHEYRERKFFHLPMRHDILSKLPWPLSPIFFMAYKHPHTFVLNIEEIATLWHFPGQILKVPTLERIESKQASPPTNLPT